jgi:hypothetical protein
MKDTPFIDSSDVERRIKQAHADRAQFMSTLLRNKIRPVIWTIGTLDVLYLALAHGTLSLR